MRTIYRLNGEAISLDVQRTIDGVTYPNLKDAWNSVGVTQHEVEDYPNQETHTWTENTDGTLNVTEIPAEQIASRDLLRASQTAQRYLNETDYLFSADRYATLLKDEPDRATILTIKREEARECVRLHKASQVAK